MVAGSLLLSCDSRRLIGETLLPFQQHQGKRPKRVKCCSAVASSALVNDRCREFKLSDFDLHSHVSVGLSGRSDELLFEGTVKNSNSDLKGMRVVLRQLTGERAQRRGKRALEVVSKLISKEYVLHSYATRVHGFIASSDQDSLTLVHGYYGCYSLHQWLLCVDWVPNLEERLALDEEASRRVGDDTTGGPEVTRQLRLIRIIMRDILIGVNYLHSEGLAHTELRLNNIHISAADRHVKVGLLANAVKFSEVDEVPVSSSNLKIRDTRKQMVAYDMRCVGFVLARMVLRELVDPKIFTLFKAFLRKEDPAGLREFLLPHFFAQSPSGSTGLQILDRDGGAGWHLLAAMLAADPGKRISCTDALRHPFLCGPRWVVNPSFEMIRWSLGSAAIRIVEEYLYMNHQRTRLAQLIDLLERVNITTKHAEWTKKLQGRWRLLYHTGKQIGLSTRKASPAVLIGEVFKTFTTTNEGKLSSAVDISFKVMATPNWSPDKSGQAGSIQIITERVELRKGQRVYQTDTEVIDPSPALERLRNQQQQQQTGSPAEPGKQQQRRNKQKRGLSHFLPKDSPKSLPILRLDVEDFNISMQLEGIGDPEEARRIVQEVRIQVPKEIFAISKLVCATYVDSRLLILRGISGAALMFIRSPAQPVLQTQT